MSALHTSSTCRDCGKSIPPALPNDALCCLCRYPSTKKAAEHLDGDGKPVPTEFELAADALAVKVHFSPAEETFEDALLGEGFDAVDAALAARVHETFLTREALARAADALREVLKQILATKAGKSPEFAALYATITRTPLHQVAAETGHSKPAIHYHLKRLPKFFLTPYTLVGGNDAATD